MLPTTYCLSLCIDWDPHSLFHFCKCVSFSTYYHIEEIEHIYNSREQNASISSLSLGFFFTYLLYAICLGENFCKLILSDGLWTSWTWMFNSLPIWDVLSIISEKAMAPHSSTLAWKILWTEEPGRLQSVRSLRVEHDWATSLSLFTLMHWRRKWQLTPVFLPGESQGRGSLVGCCLWGRTESDMTEAT